MEFPTFHDETEGEGFFPFTFQCQICDKHHDWVDREVYKGRFDIFWRDFGHDQIQKDKEVVFCKECYDKLKDGMIMTVDTEGVNVLAIAKGMVL